MGGCAFKKSHLRVLACALVACLVAGSFFDLAISSAVFDPSAPFGTRILRGYRGVAVSQNLSGDL